MGKPKTRYPDLTRISDPNLHEVIKLIYDKIGAVEHAATGIGTVTQALTTDLNAAGKRLMTIADAAHPQDAVNLRSMQKYVDAAIALAAQPAAPTSPPISPPPPPSVCYTNRALGQPNGIPGAPNLRWWRGDFSGISVPGLPAVNQGSSDASLVFTPFFDRYGPTDQATILSAYAQRGYTHFQLSWPDSRVNGGGVGGGPVGQSISQFVATAQQVQAAGFYPCVFLFSKDYDPADPPPGSIDAVVGALLTAGVMPICCVGWELNLFNTPGPPFYALIAHVASLVVPAGTNLYVHFSSAIPSWQAPGDLGAVFWNTVKGQLTGLLYQADPSWTCGFWQSKLADIQIRFGLGAAGWPTDSGFGHPFDLVAWEYSASNRFSGALTEAGAQAMGNQAICSPAPNGGPAPLAVSGYGNGGPLV